jgi:hypothetical protein
MADYLILRFIMSHFDTSISLGNILTIASFLVALWKLHRDTVKKEEQKMQMLSELKIKMDIMYGWWTKNILSGD